MKKFLLWVLVVVITLGAAYYQRKTGPTYPKRLNIGVNGDVAELKLVRSLGLDERSEVKLHITDTSVKATIWYKRYKSSEDYVSAPFIYKVYPIDSPIMNKVFKMTEEKGFFAEVPQQPAAGKLQYYIEIEDNNGIQQIFKEEPVVIRFKGGVNPIILIPHVLIMFIAMLFSTAAGLFAAVKRSEYKKYALWAFITLTIGGMILGPLVQKEAFGDLWTGIPFGWDLTDNKTLIAFVAWLVAVVMNRKYDKPIYTLLASVVLMLVYSIPHSMFGSELDYATGEVTQGFILIFFLAFQKKV
jgi:hypothetical protein